MRLPATGPGSLTIARAYGVPGARPTPTAAASSLASRLVAGAVDAGVGVETGGLTPAAAGAESRFRLYTRAADVNEVATGVALGRSIDVAG